MNKKTNKLIGKIEVFSSNSLTRMVSRQKLMPFGGDRRKYKYRISLLNSFVELEKVLEDLEASVLGSSSKSIFIAIQYLLNARRMLDKISSILKIYIAESTQKDLPLNNIDETKIEDLDLSEIIKDFDINKLNFDFSESPKFAQLENLIKEYNNGDHSNITKIKILYFQLLKELSKGTSVYSLEDILINRGDNNLLSNASLSNWLKKWYGKARHNISMFDDTSPVRLDISKNVKSVLDIVQETLNLLEDDLDPLEINSKISKINIILKSIEQIIEPLSLAIKGSSFGDEFLDLINKNKLTEFPANLSDEDKKRFQSYLNTREFKDLINMYQGKP